MIKVFAFLRTLGETNEPNHPLLADILCTRTDFVGIFWRQTPRTATSTHRPKEEKKVIATHVSTSEVRLKFRRTFSITILSLN